MSADVSPQQWMQFGLAMTDESGAPWSVAGAPKPDRCKFMTPDGELIHVSAALMTNLTSILSVCSGSSGPSDGDVVVMSAASGGYDGS